MNMRVVGAILLVAGIALFFVANDKLGKYDTLGGSLKAAFSSDEAGEKSNWEAARIGGAIAGAAGLVLVVTQLRKR